MKSWPTLLFPILCSSFVMAQGGMPYCIWQDPDDDLYHFSRLDATDGSLTTIAPILGLDAFVAGNKTTYNANDDLYHFVGLDIPNIRYYTIDALTGAILSQPEMVDNVVGIEYDCKESRHYGLREIDDVYDLVEIDPLTAVASSITPVTNLQGYVAESFNFDPRHGYYTFVAYLGTAYSLRSYHVFSGTLIYDVPFEDYYIAPEYNCPDSSIYALWEDEEVYKLERIQLDGSHTTVSVLPGITPGFVLESSSMSQEGIYTYRGFDGSNAFALISIEVSTGEIVHLSPTTDNAVGFEESLCCGIIPTNLAEHGSGNDIQLFPQPACEQLHVRSNNAISSVQIRSMDGALCLLSTFNTTGDLTSIDISVLPNGAYVAQLQIKDGGWIRKRVVKAAAH